MKRFCQSIILVVVLAVAVGLTVDLFEKQVQAAQEAKGTGIYTWSTGNGSGGLISSDTTIASGAQVIYSVVVNHVTAGTDWSVGIHDSTSAATDANTVFILAGDTADTESVIWESARGVLLPNGIWVDVTNATCTILREEPAFRPIY